MNSLKTTSLAERAANEIEKMIITNKWLPGDKLPNETDMVHNLGIGRGTLREAIKILESKNVVTIKRGRGTFVSEHVGIINDPLGFRFFNNKKKLAEDLSDFRLLLEPQIARIAALKATENDIAEMQILCDEVHKLISSGKDYSKKDIEFHTKIAAITGNSVIEQIIPLIARGIATYVDITNHSLAGTATTTHQRVVDAIRMHDPDGAYNAMYDHTKENRANLDQCKM